jgi:hypothetical protein
MVPFDVGQGMAQETLFDAVTSRKSCGGPYAAHVAVTQFTVDPSAHLQ